MSWITWPVRWVVFTAWFLWQVVLSNMTVLKDVLTPGQSSRPCVARYETRCRSEAEVSVLATAITLTPGTLTLGTRRGSAHVAHKRSWTLYVHSMYGGPDAAVDSVRRIEDKMFSATRREGAP